MLIESELKKREKVLVLFTFKVKSNKKQKLMIYKCKKHY